MYLITFLFVGSLAIFKSVYLLPLYQEVKPIDGSNVPVVFPVYADNVCVVTVLHVADVIVAFVAVRVSILEDVDVTALNVTFELVDIFCGVDNVIADVPLVTLI